MARRNSKNKSKKQRDASSMGTRSAVSTATSHPRGRLNFHSLNSNSGTMVSTMPSGIAARPIVQDFSFASRDGGRICVMHGTFPWSWVGYSGSMTTNTGILTDRNSAVISPAYLYASSSSTLANFPQFFAAAFTRYRYKRIRFSYRPCGASSTDTSSLVFGFSEDSQNPLITVVDVNRLLDLGGFAFSPWQSWDFDVDLALLSNDWYYNYQWSASVAANIRQAAQGAFNVVYNGATGTKPGPFGQLYVTVDLELCDPHPPFQSVTFADIMQIGNELETKMQAEREGKNQESSELVVPPGTPVSTGPRFSSQAGVTGHPQAYITPYPSIGGPFRSPQGPNSGSHT